MKKKIQMKEFDIEKAKAGAPVCTRDGRPVRIICWDYQEYGQQEADEKFPIIALVKCDKGERAYVYRESGKCMVDKNDELMMAPVKHEGWVNVYMSDGHSEVDNRIFGSEEIAKDAALGNIAGVTKYVALYDAPYIATTKIEWEE